MMVNDLNPICKHIDKETIAIVLPIFKKKYLQDTLRSIFSMTGIDRANVYAFDDNSPEDLMSICKSYQQLSNFHYYRFSDNLGQRDLALHWNRCIERVEEKWLWLFSDDDLVERDCLKNFFYSLRNTESEHVLYRFNTKVIDEKNAEICINKHPTYELPIDYLKAKLSGRRLGFVSEFIICRETLIKCKGFVRFPLAWNSDDATWFQISRGNYIYTIPGSFVCWRKSGENISAASDSYRDTLFQASKEYIVWLSARVENKDKMERILRSWFIQQYIYLYRNSTISIPKILKEYKYFWKKNLMSFLSSVTGYVFNKYLRH